MASTSIKWWRDQKYYDQGGWRGTFKLDGGGAYMNQGIHNVDLMYWLMGEVVEVSAFTGTLAHERIEVEDTGVAILKFANGALGTIEAAAAANGFWVSLEPRFQVLDAPGGMKIMTIHAFCQSLLRRFPLEAQVPPHFEVMDDRSAEESFRQALRINARDSDANNNYGTFLCTRKREAEGIKHFLLAVSDPLYQYPDRSYVNAGVCARRLNDLQTAENYFRSALKTQPNQIQALYQLAGLAFERKAYTEARSFLTRLIPVADDAGAPSTGETKASVLPSGENARCSTPSSPISRLERNQFDL